MSGGIIGGGMFHQAFSVVLRKSIQFIIYFILLYEKMK
jgi:hypothetical protein